MKKNILFSVCFLITFSLFSQEYLDLIAEGNHTVQEISESAEAHFDEVGRQRGTGYKPFKRWQYFAERAMDENGMLKSPEFYYNELINYNARINDEGAFSRTTVGTWEEMGPTYWNATSGYNPGVGRVTSIAVDESNLDHIIAGSQTGGVWKSLDGGSTWTVLTDNLSNIDVYSLAIDPLNSNTYYWGSNGGSIFKSTDGGATWSLHGSVFGTVNRILIDPTNTSKMYASAQSGGLFKSVNGGTSWTSIASGISTGFDFQFKPGDTNTIYASGSQFYISTNGGTTFNAGNGFSSGAKMIGVSSNDPMVVYVVEEDGGVFGGLYKSTDSGATFTELSHSFFNYFGYDSNGFDNLGQAPRDMAITVNPNDVNDVHIAGINTWRSTDGGVSFSITSQWTPGGANSENIGYCHADVDLMFFAGSGANTKLFVGSDGGIYRADDPTNVSTSYYTDLTTGMGIRQFYKIGISQTDPVIITGGSQDNGSSVLRADGNWYDWWGADGMEGFVDKNNTDIMYGTSQFGSFVKSNNGGNSVFGISQPDGKGGQSSWNWIVPFEQDPLVQNTIYCAFDQVYKSVDGGSNWTSISQNFGADVDHLKIAPTDSNKMYLAINGTLWYTSNGGTNWTQSFLFLGGSQRINSIAVHPTDADKVAIATNNSSKVYVSTDGGVTFTDIPWDLPNFSAQAVAWQDNGKDGLYVGMNYGVYYTDNDLGDTWIPFNNGLPNVRINELEINTADNKIYAATYGRGLWRSNVYEASLSVDEFKLTDFSLYPNPANDQVTLKWSKPEDVSVRVYNTLGKLVFYSKKLNIINGYNVDISNFEKGIYFVKLNSTYGELTKKLVIN
ncbi:VPS10 domain-containing protein [Winogradskyella poriferorum]|uniref:T9SS type A sorting domain-containing protein n=1 Tax=Winogradskyella poriferorum TaxID=307627 RepID=UPI003D65897A